MLSGTKMAPASVAFLINGKLLKGIEMVPHRVIYLNCFGRITTRVFATLELAEQFASQVESELAGKTFAEKPIIQKTTDRVPSSFNSKSRLVSGKIDRRSFDTRTINN